MPSGFAGSASLRVAGSLALALLACAPRSAPAPEPAAAEPIAAAPAEPAEPEYEPLDVNLRSPERTLETLVAAIAAQDLDSYMRCFTDEALLSGEAGVGRLEDPESRGWDDLAAAFYGPQELENLEVDGERASAYVAAPMADGGGVGAIRFERDEDGWKIARW